MGVVVAPDMAGQMLAQWRAGPSPQWDPELLSLSEALQGWRTAHLSKALPVRGVDFTKESSVRKVIWAPSSCSSFWSLQQGVSTGYFGPAHHEEEERQNDSCWPLLLCFR